LPLLERNWESRFFKRTPFSAIQIFGSFISLTASALIPS
jgi:hypothetical protein